MRELVPCPVTASGFNPFPEPQTHLADPVPKVLLQEREREGDVMGGERSEGCRGWRGAWGPPWAAMAVVLPRESQRRSWRFAGSTEMWSTIRG